MPKNNENGIDQELQELDMEMKRLQLIHLRHTVENETQRRASAERVSRQHELTLRQHREGEAQRQALCPHKKGGKNMEGLNNGNAQEYAIFIHTYATGEVVPMCTRCMKEWRKPAPELRVSNPKAFVKQMREYIEALKFPTDNEPSGTQLFMVTPYDPSAAAAEEAEKELLA